MRYISSTLALIAGIFVFMCAARAEPPSQDDGVEVLARGPVHEAYAEPAIAAPGATPVIARQPPALLDEVPADQKPDGDVQWISGYWAWDEDRNDFLWVSGFWRLPPPGREWIPGHWVTVDGGWQWAPGFWAESGEARRTGCARRTAGSQPEAVRKRGCAHTDLAVTWSRWLGRAGD